MILPISSNLRHLRRLSLNKFPLREDPLNRAERSSELLELGEFIKSKYIEVLADQCPSLSRVCVKPLEMEGGIMVFDFVVKRDMMGSRVEKVYMRIRGMPFFGERGY